MNCLNKNKILFFKNSINFKIKIYIYIYIINIQNTIYNRIDK